MLQSLNTRQSSGTEVPRPNTYFGTFQFQFLFLCWPQQSFFIFPIQKMHEVVTKLLITIFAVRFFFHFHSMVVAAATTIEYIVLYSCTRRHTLPLAGEFRVFFSFFSFHMRGIIKRKIKWNVKFNRTVDSVHDTAHHRKKKRRR